MDGPRVLRYSCSLGDSVCLGVEETYSYQLSRTETDRRRGYVRIARVEDKVAADDVTLDRESGKAVIQMLPR
jgi:hypothetical protein